MAIICPYCFESVSPGARCSSCNETLPSQLKLSNLMFSIAGSTESGKSHYIAILIEQLKRQAARFGWSFHAANDETINLYERRFKLPLYESLATIDKTQTGDMEARRPLIYLLDIFRGSQETRATLVFYDAAGERFNSQDEINRATRYLYYSSGVIFLADPLQMSGTRKWFLKHFPGEEKALQERPIADAKVGNIFSRLINALQGRQQGKIQVPIAITLSKIDALRVLLTDEAPVFLPPFHQGGMSLADFRRNNDYFRNLLAVIDEDREIVSNAKYFERVGYFGVSALGQNPQKTGRLQFKPRPIRPLDPMLWLLWQNGLIDGK